MFRNILNPPERAAVSKWFAVIWGRAQIQQWGDAAGYWVDEKQDGDEISCQQTQINACGQNCPICFDRLQISHYQSGKLSQSEVINSTNTWTQYSATSKEKNKKRPNLNQINREGRQEIMEHWI